MSWTDDARSCDPACGQSLGNYIAIQHPNGYVTYYGHLSAFGSFDVGESVTTDDQIGAVGDSGGAGGEHLHFEVGFGDSEVVAPYGYYGEGDLWALPEPASGPALVCGFALLVLLHRARGSIHDRTRGRPGAQELIAEAEERKHGR